MPLRYLRIPLDFEKLKIANYTPRIDAMTRKINTWSKRSLSYVGRTQLIKSILQGSNIIGCPYYHCLVDSLRKSIAYIAASCGQSSILQLLGLKCVSLKRKEDWSLGIKCLEHSTTIKIVMVRTRQGTTIKIVMVHTESNSIFIWVYKDGTIEVGRMVESATLASQRHQPSL